MHLEVRRMWLSDKSTIGTLFVDGNEECFTLEDVVRTGPKVFGETAIPEGNYKVVINFSQHFQKELPQLLNVPDFEGVRIHSGNRPEDTEGCILVGKERDIDFVGSSRDAFNALFPKLQAAIARGEPVDVTVVISQGAVVAA
jgi:hypothetical protein